MHARLGITFVRLPIDGQTDPFDGRRAVHGQPALRGVAPSFETRGRGRPPSAKATIASISSGRGAPPTVTVMVSISSKDHGLSLWPSGTSMLSPGPPILAVDGISA